ncbi:hypothetical protein GGQ04_002664 [Salinibacter ruber]|uniref:sulfotransferase family 2 domain-containing protein n=1 Tax=Salinibacter ruber TaxID=146919 RepID=UPI002168F83D|nr:sulfotransferase family 2 domain-containing protein [Salinibacter ruber]MCS4047516.1 hypothetical protein [Salinibacter ruber]
MPTTIYIHIQKTGGTTLRSILRHQYDVQYGANELYSPEEIGAYFEQPIEEDKRQKAVSGHMSFGAHQWVRGETRYITMLRDPVKRVISYYYYLIERGNKSCEYIEENNLDVADYVRDGLCWQGIPHTNNLQTRLLSGVGNTVPMGECTDEMLQQAKQNIEERFAVVGFTEAFDTSILLMRRELGWGLPTYWYQNKTSDRPRKEDFSSSTINVIRRHNRLDLELYSFCKERFRREVASTDLSADRRLLEIGNAAYEPTVNVYVRLRKAYNWITGRERW